MDDKLARVEIVVTGLVQGVGFRYFVLRNALDKRLKGYTQNLYSGEVYTIAEGKKHLLEELVEKIKIGPQHAHVHGFNVKWLEPKFEFSTFEIRR